MTSARACQRNRPRAVSPRLQPQRDVGLDPHDVVPLSIISAFKPVQALPPEQDGELFRTTSPPLSPFPNAGELDQLLPRGRSALEVGRPPDPRLLAKAGSPRRIAG